MSSEYSIEIAVNIMEIDFYRAKRYNTPMTVAIFHSDCNDVFIDMVENSLRVTDIIQYLNHETFVVIFGNTNAAGTEIAINKIINHTKAVCHDKIFVGFSEVKKADNSSETTIRRAKAGLKLAKTQKSKNVVVI